jgi:riboflavin biosynthesis pyrimidine reductase
LGGGELAREFLKEDLMDRIDLGVMPILPGAGVSSRIRLSYARVSRPPRKKG